MFKNVLVLEVKGENGRVYRLECDPNSPLHEIYNSLFAMEGIILNQIKRVNDEMKEKEDGEEVDSESN